MDQDITKRKLAAIFSADVEGYSRLMSNDEAATVNTINRYREIIIRLVETNNGRVVDAKGDNLLAEFASVVDCIQCSVQVQKDLKEKNKDLPAHRRMSFRIGINLGDVIDDKGTIYGDGVNIAARLEALAHGGGICISGTVYDHVRNRLGTDYEYLGERSVKNIPDPVRVYRIILDGSAEGLKKQGTGKNAIRTGLLIGLLIILVAAGIGLQRFYSGTRGQIEKDVSWEMKQEEVKDEIKGQVPVEEASIVVLPFENMSGDKSQDYIVNGITENIITVLSKTPNLLVINRDTSYTYKEKSVDVEQVGRELNVRYILKGSVQKAGNQIRISVQLIGASSGELLWAERYDRTVKDIFALQDEITLKIINSLDIQISSGQRASILSKGTENLEAYLKILQGLELVRNQTSTSLAEARKLAEEVIELDPNYPKGYTLLSMTMRRGLRTGKGDERRKEFEKIIELAQKSLDLDPNDILANVILGNIYIFRKEYDKAFRLWERVVAANPNSAEALHAMGNMLLIKGKPMEAIPLFEKANKMMPFPSREFWIPSGQAYLFSGMHEKALSIFKELKKTFPSDRMINLNLIAAYSAMGMMDESKKIVTEVKNTSPVFSMEKFSNRLPFINPDMKTKFLGLLEKAGLE